jgi:glycosyltransferase involved in cell wall biosynthesis
VLEQDPRDRLSLVVIGLNEAPNLKRCFRSAREGVREARFLLRDWEFIYVDSGSNDESVAIAKQYCSRVFRLQSCPTAAAARTVGLEKARGDLVLFLDGDMELQTGWLLKAVHVLANQTTSRIVGVTGIRDDVFVTGDGTVLKKRKDVYGVQKTRLARQLGGAWLARREAVKLVGGYRPDLQASEEPDLYARLLSRGFYVLELEIPFICHFTPPQPAPHRRFAKLLRLRGGSYWFGCSFWYAIRERYFQGLLRVFWCSAVVWGVDLISVLVFAFFGWLPPAVLQLGLIVALGMISKPAEYVLARARLYGVLLASFKCFLATIRREDHAQAVARVSWEEL